MAKATRNKTAPVAAPAAGAASAVALPESLLALLPAFQNTVLLLAKAQNLLDVADGDEAKANAETQLVEATASTTAAWAEIVAWIEGDLKARVEAAGVEADRQLAEKRAELQAQLDAVATHIAKVQERSAALTASSENTPQSEGERGAGDTASPDAGEAVTIEVTGPKKGRWRAGIYFDSTPKVVTVTAEQFDKIDGDPTLTMRQVD